MLDVLIDTFNNAFLPTLNFYVPNVKGHKTYMSVGIPLKVYCDSRAQEANYRITVLAITVLQTSEALSWHAYVGLWKGTIPISGWQ